MFHELFVEIMRNGIVESRHFGAAVVCDHEGNVVESWGDTDQLIFPRSALKPMQAINLVKSGAAEHFGLSDAELSMACSSHLGEPIHQKLVRSWLDRLGLSQEHLACGAALPEDLESTRKLLAAGEPACRIHHNCSGKHTGFLTTALHLDLPLADYHLVDHPLQQLSLDTLSLMAGCDLRGYSIGVDGCGFPAITLPLAALGTMVARFAKPTELPGEFAKAILRLHDALIHGPLYAAGHGTEVTDLYQITKGAVLAKTGAEGILTAALPARGLGIALKIADGSARARPVALLAILDHLGVLSGDEKSQLQTHIIPQIINSRGLVVGEIRSAHSWLSA